MFCKSLKIAILLPNVLGCFENVDSCIDVRSFCFLLQNMCRLWEFLRVETDYCLCLSETSGGRFAKFETLFALDLFEYVHRVITVKIHLHHSHGTGKIRGYAHDFCKMKVRENSQMEFSCIAHNFFGFDMFFMLNGIWLSVWQMQDLNSDSQVKFIDTMKYYPSSLGSLTSGKGVILCEKIKTINSLSLQPENGNFFTKSEFHSMLKGCAVDDVEYNNSKML